MIPADRKTAGAAAEGCESSGARPSRNPMVRARESVAAATPNPPTFRAVNQECRGGATSRWIRNGDGLALAPENRRSRRAEIQLTAPSSPGAGAAFSNSSRRVSSV